MAPGTPIAGDATVDGDGPRPKLHRWPENSKVYTRKFKNPKINPNPKPQAPSPVPLPHPSPPKPSPADDVTPPEPLPEPSRAAVATPPSPDVASSLNPDDQEQEDDGKTVKINLRSRSKDEICELRTKLTAELEQVREFARKIESLYGGGEYTQSQHSAAPVADDETEAFEREERVPSNYRQLSVLVAPEHHGNGNSVIDVEGFEEEEEEPTPSYPKYRQLNGHGNGFIRSFEREERPPRYRQLNVSVAPETEYGGMVEGFEREKRTPKANQLYQNSDFILIGKDKFPPEMNGGSNKKLKTNRNLSPFLEKRYAQAFKKCAALLAKLMKHNFGWVFNAPVDVKGLGLHDYYIIIKHPMDLGTVKQRLNKNWYKSPEEFAEDVRLTFRNAMTYNPKGQDVHLMAQTLLQIFEQQWLSIEAEYAYSPLPLTPVVRKPPPIDVRMLERLDTQAHPMAVETKTKPVHYPAPAVTPIGRPPVLRQPKPKAKDLYKREMTVEEKQKLSGHLQNLPPEKLDGVVQIIRKRNAALCPQEDEIEIDIDCVDTETLWELDRFVTNYKKSLSKYKRKAELAMLAKAQAEREGGQERVMEREVMREPRENNTVMGGREVESSYPLEVKSKGENASRSSSSSSSSSDSGSSSSDSDSDSSSASDAGD